MSRSRGHWRRIASTLVLLAAPAALLRPEQRHARELQALLAGPLAPALASVQWTQAQSLLRRGELGPGLHAARGALALCPRSAPLWAEYARVLALQLGSPEREPDPRRRADWLSAGLAALDEGARASGEPAGFAFARAFVLLAKAGTDPAIDWPGGSAELDRSAREALAAAAELGHGPARALLEGAGP